MSNPQLVLSQLLCIIVLPILFGFILIVFPLITVSWFLIGHFDQQAHSYFGYGPCSFCLSVNYLDRFLSVHELLPVRPNTKTILVFL